MIFANHFETAPLYEAKAPAKIPPDFLLEIRRDFPFLAFLSLQDFCEEALQAFALRMVEDFAGGVFLDDLAAVHEDDA